MHAANYKKDIEIWTVESRQLSFRVRRKSLKILKARVGKLMHLLELIFALVKILAPRKKGQVCPFLPLFSRRPRAQPSQPDLISRRPEN